MKKSQPIYTYICEDCGKAIYSTGQKRIYKCDKCYRKEKNRQFREKKGFNVSADSNEGIHSDIADIEKYNEEQGLHLSYGQYKLRLYLDKLGRRKK